MSSQQQQQTRQHQIPKQQIENISPLVQEASDLKTAKVEAKV